MSESGGAAQPGARVRGLLWVTLAYVVALAVANCVVLALGTVDLWTSFAADVAATVVVFAFSRLLNNSSVYDAYWSVAPIALVGWWAWVLPGHPVRSWLVVGLVTLWGVRLTLNWATGWAGLHHEDWRYVDFRRLGVWYWPLSLGGLHLFPTVQVFLGLLPTAVYLGWLRMRTGSIKLCIFVHAVACTGLWRVEG